MEQCPYNSIMASKCGSYRGDYDGCSSPKFQNWLNNQFRDACNLHDLCYSTPGISKRHCDRWFWKNMQQTCALQGKSGRCKGTAYGVYVAVVVFGSSSFNNAQNWANKNCGIF